MMVGVIMGERDGTQYWLVGVVGGGDWFGGRRAGWQVLELITSKVDYQKLQHATS